MTRSVSCPVADPKAELTAVRKFWADIQNEKFMELGLDIRVDHRTLKEQGIEREPTTHLGPAVSAMQRQGMDTQVGRRIWAQQQLAAKQRIERLLEIRTLERERLEVDKSIRDVSQDMAAAQKDLVVHRPTLSLEDIRRQAREEWLKLRAERLAQAQSPAPAAGKAVEKTPDPEAHLTLEERRQRAAERWAERRREQLLNPGRERESERKDEPNRELDRDHGIDDDFGP